MQKIYCAGPLFNHKEKEEMREIAEILESNGYLVFLPQRDGFEFANLSQTLENMHNSPLQINKILNQAIFALDVFHVLDSDGLLLNINGRVPDEGAMVEAGIAWNAGKKIVIYKNDSRSLINGNDNPLLLGLSGFELIDSITAIPAAFSSHFQVAVAADQKIDNWNVRLLYNKGKEIAAIAESRSSAREICTRLIKILHQTPD